MVRNILIRFIAALSMVAPAAAAKDANTDAHLANSVETFKQLCLDPAPKFPDDPKVFASRGYVKPTSDAAVFANTQGGFAGIGYAGAEGEKSSSTKPNGCLVYVKGLDAARAAALTDAAMRKRFQLLDKRQANGDVYWLIRDFAPRRFIAFVAPKSEGTYAGHTLLMIVEQSPPPSQTAKTPPAIPKNKKLADEMIEHLKTAPPDERIAFLSSLQFSQCLLATDFLKIAFDKETGVKRVPSSRRGENLFSDSTTGSLMMANARQCIVAYPGNNVKASMSGITPFIRMRDKTAKTSAYKGGYLVRLQIDGKPHVISIAPWNLKDRKMVRMVLLRGRGR